jgi:hypothetical protein
MAYLLWILERPTLKEGSEPEKHHSILGGKWDALGWGCSGRLPGCVLKLVLNSQRIEFGVIQCQNKTIIWIECKIVARLILNRRHLLNLLALLVLWSIWKPRRMSAKPTKGVFIGYFFLEFYTQFEVARHLNMLNTAFAQKKAEALEDSSGVASKHIGANNYAPNCAEFMHSTLVFLYSNRPVQFLPWREQPEKCNNNNHLLLSLDISQDEVASCCPPPDQGMTCEQNKSTSNVACTTTAKRDNERMMNAQAGVSKDVEQSVIVHPNTGRTRRRTRSESYMLVQTLHFVLTFSFQSSH